MQDRTYPAACGAAFLLAALSAQSVRAEEATLVEVIVTAQKRSENLQDVPMAISALGEETLERLRIRSLEDLSRTVPSFAFTPLAPGETRLSIRGLTQEYGLSPTVAYYVDETPIELRSDAFSATPSIDLYDVERIEVLRGPQGTLYGSSSLGGAVRIVTAQPRLDAFDATAAAELSQVSDGGTGYAMRGALNTPITEKLALRVVGSKEHFGGFVDRTALSDIYAPAPNDPVIEKDVDAGDVSQGRVALKWQPTDDLSITPSFLYQSRRFDGNSQVDANRGGYSRGLALDQSFDSDLKVANLRIEQSFAHFDLLSSTSHIDKQTDTLSDYTYLGTQLGVMFGAPPSPPIVMLNDAPVTYRTWSQEFRLMSIGSERLRWVTGAFFSDTRQTVGQTLTSAAFGEVAANAFGIANDPVNYDFFQVSNDRQYALFGEGTLTFGTIEVMAGLRGYRLENDLENVSSGVLAGPPQPHTEARKSGINPKVSVSWQASDDTRLYATVAKGFRLGGPNVELAGINCSLGSVYRPLYDPDSVVSYEVGTKLTFGGGRGTLNAAVYELDWRDVQQSVADPVCGSLFIANVGDARSRGVEAELAVQLTDALLLSAGASYIDAQFTDIDAGFADALPVRPGDAVTQVPKVQANVAAEYRTTLSGRTEGFLRADWRYVDDVATSYTDRSSTAHRPAYDQVNASAGISLGVVDITAFASNLTNERAALELADGFFAVPGINVPYFALQPRTIGVSISYRLSP